MGALSKFAIPFLLVFACAAAFAQQPCEATQPFAEWSIRHISGDPKLSVDPGAAEWREAATTSIVKDCSKVLDYPKLKSEVRGFWTDSHLYLLFVCPYEVLNLFLPATHTVDRDKLWDRDVVEFFLGGEWERPGHYREFEIAPTGDQVDLDIEYDRNRFDQKWNSGWQTAARIDEARHVWYAAARIPLKAVIDKPVTVGTRWHANLYRIDGLGPDTVRHFMCWQPTCVKNRDPNHVPEHFGTLRFAK